MQRVTNCNSTTCYTSDFTKPAMHSMPCKFLGNTVKEIVSQNVTLGHRTYNASFHSQIYDTRIYDTVIKTEKLVTCKSTHY